jgi:hypothetical protein
MTKVIKVNELQLATYEALRSEAETVITNAKTGSTAFIVREDVLLTMKQNVVNALIRAGALETFRTKHVRIVDDVEVTLLVRKPNIRTLRKQEADAQVAA